MQTYNQYGFYLFQKSAPQTTVLKEMLQFLRSHAPGKSLQFAYVEGETSLIPHLTLWENIHVALGGESWKEFIQGLEPDLHALANLITDPHLLSEKASPWERLTISLLKGALMNCQHILVDMNEEIHSPFNVMNFKKILTVLAQRKNVHIATANTALWLDSCHSLIKREGFVFMVETLDTERIKRHRIA